MDYAALKIADAALKIADPQLAADALNLQTVVRVRDIPVGEVYTLLIYSEEYGALRITADLRTYLAPITRAVVEAAINLIATLERTPSILATVPARWTSAQKMVSTLRTAGVISVATVTALTALRSVTEPAWDMWLTSDDVMHARSL